MRCREVINEFMKIRFVFLRLFNRALCLEQYDRLQIDAVFGSNLLFILVENNCLYDAISFLKIRLNNIDIFGIAVVAELPQIIPI